MQELNQNKTIAVGMSGGVDSSVAAHLLLEQGFRVIGVTMRTTGGENEQWEDECASHVSSAADAVCEKSNMRENAGTPWEEATEQAIKDARLVADQLGIEHRVVEAGDVFSREVIRHFTGEYREGRTPNPCVVCNRHVKWAALLAACPEIGADMIATGHYAKVVHRENGRYAVCAADAAEKDQTYALYGLTQEQLARTLFPLGSYAKPEIRAIAERAGLPVAHKRDSQEICFIPDGDYAAFIEQRCGVASRPGNFVTEDGAVLGRHRGIIHYTIGQRRGLGLPMGERVFVTEIRPETNEVVVGGPEAVFADALVADHLNFMGIPAMQIGASETFLVKIRYNHRGTMCTVTRTGEDEITCRFHEPVRAVTPGQAVVFYDGPYIAGGGRIRGAVAP